MHYIDLHTHSTASDGTLTPTELIHAAARAELKAVALTDHDTTAGLAEAAEAARGLDLEFIPGCELSAETPNYRMHILGLWLPENPVALETALSDLRHYRHNRNHIILDKLKDCGVEVEYEQIRDIAGDGSVGRPHIARFLLQAGYVASIQEAFDIYLGSGGKAYAPKRILTAKDAIAMLKNEGATVILAHPGLLGASREDLESEVRSLMDYGLDGIEVYYTEHGPSKTRSLLDMAERLGLVYSGGSDFHGANKPRISLGRGKGGLRVPHLVLEKLKAHRAGN